MVKVLTIYLREDTFVPGKKNYERARKCLEENLNDTFDVIVAWDPPEDKICPSSIAAWFHERGYTVNLCKQKFTERIEGSLNVPNFQSSGDPEKFFEWLGIFSIAGDITNGKDDDYVNTYTCPMPHTNIDNILHIKCSGFFTRKQILRIYEATRNFMTTNVDKMPWGSLDVQGFADSPVSWGLKEHNFYVDGDNSYTIVFQSNGDCVIRKSLCSNKKPRMFQ